jgi:hypothetical protein
MVNRPLPARLGLLLPLTVALASSAAWAQQEVVALHPCVITGGKPKSPTAELEAVCALEVARTTVRLVPSTTVREHLEKEARGSCARAKNRNACLGKLASATGATRTLYITIAPNAPRLARITGQVLDANGKVLEQKKLELPRARNQQARDTVRFAVAQLLPQLALTSAPLVPMATEPVAPLEPTPAQPEPEPTPAQPEPLPLEPLAVAPPRSDKPLPVPIPIAPPPEPPSRTWKTPAGIAGVGAGVVGLGLATLFTLQANDATKELNAFYANGTAPVRTDDTVQRIRELRDSADSKRTLALVSGAAGVVLAGAGAVLWLTDTPPAPGTARLSVGPGSVGLLVVLP